MDRESVTRAVVGMDGFDEIMASWIAEQISVSKTAMLKWVNGMNDERDKKWNEHILTKNKYIY
ncbi:hypothetical protein [Mechercharimyces sp. CAU 1602]|uniref:hypothetical protein n=1 Tax=Mechercharimyces sp. CAU 1602 TaxID=2973933 RepID=UPI002161ACC4|nr:hypothetical protein [Mechercharimyces sp. CAU 1602]MCS1352183.1 hypothetical protein [Mechercharimyces sp. CAU 1602]